MDEQNRQVYSLGSQEIGQGFEAVGVDEVDTGLLQHGPSGGVVGGGPEADFLSILVGLLDDALELGLLGCREITLAAPLEVRPPTVADPRHEMRARPFANTSHNATERKENLEESKKDLEWQEKRSKRKIKKLNFEVR